MSVGEIVQIILSLFSIIVAIVGIIFSIKNYLATEHVLSDSHFVDREKEERLLYRYIFHPCQHDSERFIVISGKSGIGKTSLCRKVCDDINFDNRKKWKNVFALYYNNETDKSLSDSILEKYVPDSKQIISLSKRIHFLRPFHKYILFLDNVDMIKYEKAHDFAISFIKCHCSNYVILAVDTGKNAFDISPGRFCAHEVALLSDSLKIHLPDTEKSLIADESRGLPLLVRYMLRIKQTDPEYDSFSDITGHVIKTILQLNSREKELLAIIIILNAILHHGIDRDFLSVLDSSYKSEALLEKIMLLPVVEEKKGQICTLKEISSIYTREMPDEFEKAYELLYRELIKNEEYENVVLASAVYSHMDVDVKLIVDILTKQYGNGNIYLIIDIFDECKTLNPFLLKDKNFMRARDLYYIQSLIKIGQYDKAQKYSDSNKDFGNRKGILGISDDIDFQYQYALIDLDHLTNHFREAALYADMLVKKATNNGDRDKCLYMKAHCMRHMGDNLPEAYNIFMSLGDSVDVAHEIRIRSLYSAGSIKMFFGDTSYKYDKLFEHIDEIISKDKRNKKWKPYVARHKAIYFLKFKKDYKMAEQVLLRAEKNLETNIQRILYDIYFELAELYRIRAINDDLAKSFDYYKKALSFALRENDVNLETSSQMGLHLLSLKYSKMKEDSQIQEILKRTKKNNLEINYQYAEFVRIVESETVFSDSLISYWEKAGYSDLSIAARGKHPENIKLTVM